MALRASLRLPNSILGNRLINHLTALVIAFFTWALLTSEQTSHITRSVPVVIYGSQGRTYYAPETLSVTVAGKNRALRLVDYDSLAIHVDASDIKSDKPMSIDDHHLLLPSGVHVVHFSPLFIKLQAPDSTS
jgi:hypothetical protein